MNKIMKDGNNAGCSFICPIQAATEVIGGKWKAHILYHLQGGTKRFNELKRLLPGVTQRMLTKQLRELEADQIIHRKIFAEVPPKVEYSITEFGLTLAPSLRALQEWGAEYLEKLTSIRNQP
ncbi:MAG: helix-turn-helix transcriptional regulator [Gammaproteobacteria bacterium]|nr:helix-turn-helix transcriptional regulator [Gammaproteobacteria bacterium]